MMRGIGSWSAAAGAIFGLEALMQRRLLRGISLLETRPLGYTPRDTHEVLAALGESGRRSYEWFQVLDFGLIFALTRAMLAMQQKAPVRLASGPLRLAPILPLAYAATDAAENLALAAMAAAFPQALKKLSRAASRVTSMKFVFVGASLMLSVWLWAWGTIGDDH